ncbi:hypothetical protein [Acinetobacter gyllenbergii]|uniref:hypothetical protein n=1 Tax=Acinetobacter gyllenbergii TaxID=134534 RepID=UPI000806DCA8|nr:hypothetical protein [Acinetobacter gyllenbergii]OBY75909.1 hypothetical protein NG55_04350 [Acinetobacter gyllenbergii]
MAEETSQTKFKFALSDVELPKIEDGDKRRKFIGVVYNGGRIDNHSYWGREGVVIDLQNIKFKTKTGLIEEHIGGFRVGVATETTIDNSVKITGHFLSNKRAQEIVSDADEEFPFQMSWWADPESVEQVPSGRSVTVNGQTFQGPVNVFRNVRIHEYTICTTAADTSTTIEAFSAKSNSTKEDTNVTELEQAQADKAKAEQERDDALNKLKQFEAKKRTDDITALETELKVQFSAEDKTAYTAMDESTFTFTAKQLRQFSSKTPPLGNSNTGHLFSHQAKNEGEDQQNKFGAGSLVDQAKNRK